VRGELVDLDLAKLAYVADTFALEGAEVARDAGLFEIDYAGEGFVQEAANGEDGEIASLGLVFLPWVSLCVERNVMRCVQGSRTL